MKVGIDLGTGAGGASATVDLEELLATRLLVQGNSGSGKSHLLRRLLEQSAPWVQQCVIDPEGDFVTLGDRFGHVVVDAARTETELQRIAARIRQHRVSVVLNLEGLDVEQQMRAAAAFLGGMFDAERDYWYPVLVVVAYLVLGFVFHLWHPGWIIFLTIPLFYLPESQRQPVRLLGNPVMITIIYLLLGTVCDLWHPGWLIFLLIPLLAVK